MVEDHKIKENLAAGVEAAVSSFEITLSSDEASDIKEGLSMIKYDSHGGDGYVSAVRVAAYKCMPQRILDILEKQKSAKLLSPYFIFNNLPIDSQINGSPSFDETGALFKSGNLSENVICAIAAIIGEPYSIYFEGRELVNNLTPQKDTKHDYTGLGSEVELDLHIENSALKYMSEDDCSPRGMFLLGIRKDINAIGPKTFVSDSREALKLLDQNDIETLYGNNFIVRLPYRWRSAFSGGKENTDLSPMISGPISLPRISAVFYPDMVLPVNDRAKKAFDRLYQAMRSVSVGVDITPGKLVYIDNRFVLHSREKYYPTYDQNDRPYRWVQRLFVTSSLWNFRKFTSTSGNGGRVFDPSIVN